MKTLRIRVFNSFKVVFGSELSTTVESRDTTVSLSSIKEIQYTRGKENFVIVHS